MVVHVKESGKLVFIVVLPHQGAKPPVVMLRNPLTCRAVLCAVLYVQLWDNTHWLLALPFSPAGVQVLLLMIHR